MQIECLCLFEVVVGGRVTDRRREGEGEERERERESFFSYSLLTPHSHPLPHSLTC